MWSGTVPDTAIRCNARMAVSNSPRVVMTMANPSDEQIRERAHQLWEAAGSPEGREQEFWYQAEKELRGDGSNPDEKSSTFIE